jgi:predicted thioesterase
MKQFETGEKRSYLHRVRPDDTARFESGEVHPVYATFAIARDAEWVCRLFVIEGKDDDEEGIGTFVHVNHHSPALVDQEVVFTATVEIQQGHEIICTFHAHIGERLVASGRTGQKVIKKTRLESLFAGLK